MRPVADTLRIEPVRGDALEVDGKPYRGDLEIFADGLGGLTVVNLVQLEDYLLGVVPLEIGSPGPSAIQAVMAQAVAARTYAVSHVGRWVERGFDLYGDVRDQVYGGVAAEREAASHAVHETMGVVATYEGRLIRAYYSAACGGTIAAVEETWNYPPEPYLRSHRDRRGGADFCRLSKHYRWEERWSASRFMDLLARYLPAEFGGPAPTGELEDVRVADRNSSGRVRLLVVRAGGREYRLGGDRVRWVLRRPGGGILRSSQFEVRVERRRGQVEVVIARGAGNGHGVGLCQAGAIRMATEGFSYREILGHYYPGIRLARLRSPEFAQEPASTRLRASCRPPTPLVLSSIVHAHRRGPRRSGSRSDHVESSRA
jgi:stage II sporulation protein D